MRTSGIRQKLHSYLEVADDKKVKAMYVMLQGDIEESAVEYSDEFKKELESRYADYKSGKEKVISASQSKKRIQNLLKSRSKK